MKPLKYLSLALVAFLATASDPDGVKIAGCTAAETSLIFPLHAGRAGFGSEPGYDPCSLLLTVAVEPATWGWIKKSFGEPAGRD